MRGRENCIGAIRRWQWRLAALMSVKTAQRGLRAAVGLLWGPLLDAMSGGRA